MQALDLADDGTFFCCMFVLKVDFAPLPCKLRKKQSGCGCVHGAAMI